MSQANVEFVLAGYARFNAGEQRPELWFWHVCCVEYFDRTEALEAAGVEG